MTQTNSFHHEKVHTFHKMKVLALENFTTILQFTAGFNPRNDTISNNRGSQFVNKNIDGENSGKVCIVYANINYGDCQ